MQLKAYTHVLKYQIQCDKKSSHLYFCGDMQPKEPKKLQAMMYPPIVKPIYTTLAHQYPDIAIKHRGIDIIGTKEVLSALSGVVVESCSSFCISDYGRYIIISHENGYYTVYGHLSQVFVKNGQQIVRNTREEGTLLGYMGMTGKSQGVHLHFEVRSAQSAAFSHRLDPVAFIDISLSECHNMFGLVSALKSRAHAYAQFYDILEDGRIFSKKMAIT
ncbi:hypothetical protein AwErysi_08640 [Erysipelotrichaceae bacterium]|nr:hypothetical protein AwErysi_08640 [Erysipelotrichaceae bacterium]